MHTVRNGVITLMLKTALTDYSDVLFYCFIYTIYLP